VDNASIAEIVAIKVPPWALFSYSQTPLPGQNVTVSLADLGNSVGPTTTPVHLLTLTIRGLEEGETHLDLTVHSLDDDSGGEINSTTTGGGILVTKASRIRAVETIEEQNSTLYLDFFSIIGGSNEMLENDTTADFFNIEALPHLALTVFTDQLGSLAIVIIFALPFLMMWIVGKGIEIPTITGIVIGVYVITRLPAEYQLPAVAGLTLGVTAILYTMLKERL